MLVGSEMKVNLRATSFSSTTCERTFSSQRICYAPVVMELCFARHSSLPYQKRFATVGSARPIRLSVLLWPWDPMSIVSAASLTSLSYFLYPCRSSSRNSCDFATAVGFAGHVKKYGRHFAEKDKLVGYKQSGSESLAVPGYKKVPIIVRSPERWKSGMVHSATESKEAAVRILGPERKVYPLLWEPLSWSSQL